MIWDWFVEAAGHNILIEQLIEDEWITPHSLSLHSYFATRKGVQQWDAVLMEAIEKYDASRVESFKDDIRGLIIVADTCVIKTYRTSLYMKIRPVYKIKSPFIEKALSQYQIGKIGVFIVEKLMPVILPSMRIAPFVDATLMKQNIMRGLRVLHNHGLCHGDVSMDNTGYREKTSQYVLFDFDSISRIPPDSYCQKDYDSWMRSLRMWNIDTPRTTAGGN